MEIDELFKILLSKKPSIEIIENEDIIFNLIPELKKCKGFNQNNKWHPYDVYVHILHVIDYVPNNLILRLTALFHDIGKPDTYTEDENGIGHFYNHWLVSQKIFDAFAVKYNLDKKLKNIVSNLIYYHDINVGKLDENGLNNLVAIFTKEELIMLFEFKKADLLSQNSEFHYLLEDYDEQKKKILKYKACLLYEIKK